MPIVIGLQGGSQFRFSFRPSDQPSHFGLLDARSALADYSLG
jgi:hypothetical protein